MHPSSLKFRKSSYSDAANACVEVAQTSSGAAVRDSVNPHEGHLEFSAAEWTAFVTGAVTGKL